MLTVKEAYDKIMASLPEPQVETLPLIQSLNAVLAEDAISDIDIPPFDKSAMDGFAVMAEDTHDPQKPLTVIENIPAGTFPAKTVTPGTAARIMTGAALPQGADAVLMVEDSRKDETNPDVIFALKSIEPGKNVSPKGEDLMLNQIALRKGKFIRPQEIAILASTGKHKVTVYKRPAVSVISTGDELVEINQKPGPGQIRNSNSYMLIAQLCNTNCPYAYLGVGKDNIEYLRAKVAEGLKADVLILTGGVSVGDYDVVVDALEKEGVDIIFRKVAIKPGKPFVFGKKDNTMVFAMPGNPVSAFVIFEVFVRAALAKLMRNPSLDKKTSKAKLSGELNKTGDREQFLAAEFIDASQDGLKQVRLIPSHGSADIISFAKADCLLAVPAGSPPLQHGQLVDILLLN
ncbi:MAG: molybdopterin molybdotransferase MoeA [Planctomycetes bacterium]|nr:molybdopterin molybdotransferase MoeA [Planctomycetota bacterium]